jgi:PPM family protein phosphatase
VTVTVFREPIAVIARRDVVTETSPVTTPAAVAAQPNRFASPIHIDVSALSHPGRVRPNNEDQFFVTKVVRSLETMLSSLPPGDVPDRTEDVNYAMVVADGMGGHASGEVASRLAISTLVRFALDLSDWVFRVEETDALEIERRVRELVQRVGSELNDQGEQDPALRGMGSTMTGARTYGHDLLIVHVGDSRAYLFRDGCLHRLTKDHTYAQMLVDIGRLTPAEVPGSGVGHILTNALGGSTPKVDVDVDLIRLADGDRLLLCSDGLTDLVDDAAITSTLVGMPTSSDACAQLVQLALDAGGRDNITALVASCALHDEPARTIDEPAIEAT